MNDNQQNNAPRTFSREQILNFTSNNLDNFLEQHSMTARDLSLIIDITPPTISAVRCKKKLPSVDFLIALKENFNISIDDFLTKNIEEKNFCTRMSPSDLEKTEIMDYEKYIGTYYMYYLDTGSKEGEDTKKASESLTFGLLYIYKNPDSCGLIDYKCLAILGLGSQNEVQNLKRVLNHSTDIPRFIQSVKKHYDENIFNIKIYNGDLKLTRCNAFLSMSHHKKDMLLASFNRVSGEKQKYYGGLGTINSISSGKFPMPVMQFIGISRARLLLSSEEIHHQLLLGSPVFTTKEETKELIRLFKNCYLSSNGLCEHLSEDEKELLIRGNLDRFVQKMFEHNTFRYVKVSTDKDNEWYHIIKERSDIQNEKMR